ncbi:MAG: hypothetical protein ACK5MQ_13325 [Pikeienuella sp.]
MNLKRSTALAALAALSPGLAPAEPPSTERLNTLEELIRFLGSQELRDRYELNYPPGKIHNINIADEGETDFLIGFERFFTSYAGDIPPGLSIVVTALDEEGYEVAEIYQCPDEGDRCVFDPARPRKKIASEDVWRYSYPSMSELDLGQDNESRGPDYYPLETSRNGRMAAWFVAQFHDEPEALSAICLRADFHEKRLLGFLDVSDFLEAEMDSKWLYCYDPKLDRVMTSWEKDYGYTLSAEQDSWIRPEYEKFLGGPLPPVPPR